MPDNAAVGCRTRMGYVRFGHRRWGVEVEYRRWDYCELRFVGRRNRILTWQVS